MTRFVMIDENLKVLDKIPDDKYAIVDTINNDTWYVVRYRTFKWNDLFPFIKEFNKLSLFSKNNWIIPNITKLIELGDYEQQDFLPIKIFGGIIDLFPTASCGTEFRILSADLGTGCIHTSTETTTFICVLLCPNYNPLRG